MPDRITMLALAALYEAAEASYYTPAPDRLWLRALLGLVHARSNGDRRCYDEYWRIVTDSTVRVQAGYSRSTHATTQCHAIARTVGVEPSRIDVNNAIRKLIGVPDGNPEAHARRLLAERLHIARLDQEIVATKGLPRSREARALVADRVAAKRPINGS